MFYEFDRFLKALTHVDVRLDQRQRDQPIETPPCQPGYCLQEFEQHWQVCNKLEDSGDFAFRQLNYCSDKGLSFLVDILDVELPL